MAENLHGGTDALGVPAHDFSTNANSCGPCPQALAALRAAHAQQYPDPAYTALRARLGAFHGVDAARILLAGSASEFIFRITAHAARRGMRHVLLPVLSYGDYAQAARAWGLECSAPTPGPQDAATLQWACEPSSPLGQADPALARWQAEADGQLRVLDCAYQPLRLDGRRSALPAGAWQVWTPNKALGMTGVRAAYAVAPEGAQAEVAALQALAASWVVGAHGVALLEAWTTPEVQQWIAHSRTQLARWKDAQIALCTALGWQVVPGSLANYFVARWPAEDWPRMGARLAWLRREHGIKLRDTCSFGLPGAVRLGVLPPASQQALGQAWRAAQLLDMTT
ncbi:aminotransferase class I/II-fold pyridoxal phosphate-dependent enzyme [Comamonas endophytica]|uniref:Aminotransferase class I/II-fold pyridoxal phosphate-dependent enzyme n=1 Tax=Comamonas endophytica TaxID=2949090 RepID=A0ABY6GAT4_9BURK|nr:MULTISPECIES: aminotransferase class I/II-fold pyridoxal phosphate-dependent enzyme [unclassified Acidovorax]MCD2513970.1 aminotransferase class I/II-fold pyridoxal phosphate-dependent enzyme [Acidovorax sp. D4N7]UYG52038.1 aminotransferase class I/II-fold pyridoxal phosphate-dependent enzyme [Acidovorax sp. 5MLIR]